MADGEQAIVITGTGEERPGGRAARPLKATTEPNGTLWFGAELDPGTQVWFRIAEDAISRLPDSTPEARGRELLRALNRWLEADRALKSGINRFEVQVAEDGDTWIEQLRW